MALHVEPSLAQTCDAASERRRNRLYHMHVRRITTRQSASQCNPGPTATTRTRARTVHVGRLCRRGRHSWAPELRARRKSSRARAAQVVTRARVCTRTKTIYGRTSLYNRPSDCSDGRIRPVNENEPHSSRTGTELRLSLGGSGASAEGSRHCRLTMGSYGRKRHRHCCLERAACDA